MDHPLKHWLPYKVVNAAGQPQCYWLNTLGMPFTEPFFDETRTRLIQHNTNYGYRSVSDLGMIKEWSGWMDDVAPAFIFHISRCGSTLVSQLLASINKNIVLSEVPFLDELLRLPMQYPGLSDGEIDELFTASVKFYSQKPGTCDEPKPQVFIKADSWHLFFYEQLRRLYPDAPFIAIYRQPNEVFRSQKKQPGMHAVAGVIEPELFGFKRDDAVLENGDTYLAAVLESYFKKCLEISDIDQNFLLLNYNEGPMQMVNKTAAAANLFLSPQDLESMEERSHYHSKKPDEKFSEELVTQIPECLEKAMELYQRVEEKRIAINS